MSKHLWKPVDPAVVEAAWQASMRGLSLRAVAAELATRDMLSPSDREYLPGSIANMLRDRAPVIVVDDPDPDVEIDVELEPGVDCQSLPRPIVDATVFDAAHGLPSLEPLTEPKPQTVDAAPPADPIVDAQPVKPWKPRYDGFGYVDFRSLLRRLADFPEDVQAAAMSSAKLRLDQMGLLADRAPAREIVASWLELNT